MSVKQEHSTKFDPEIKIKIEKNDDDSTEILDKKETVNTVIPE